MDLYGAFFRTALLPAWETHLKKRPTLAYWQELERTQWCSLDELYALQTRELGRLLRHANDHTPYYRDCFRAAGISPEDIRSVEDLQKLPVLTRDAARDHLQARKSTTPPFPEVRKMTSGTTGQPLEFCYDWNSEYWRQAMKMRGYGWAGYRPGARSLHYWGRLDALYNYPWKHRVKTGLDRRLKRELYVDCTDRSEEGLDRVLRIIEETKPEVMVCYSQAIASLSRHVVERGRRTWDTIPILCAAERVFPADREVIEKAFGPAVFETYGSREVMLMASECEAHSGLHISMENLIVEVLVNENGRMRPAQPGETGEVAVTDLHNYGCPFIRYLNGDLAIAGESGRCGCGRELLRITSVEGRRNDTLRDAHGQPVSGMFFTVLFSVLADKVRHFQAVQRKDGSLELKLVPTSQFNDAVLQGIRQNCSKYLRGVDVKTELVNVIPASANGKHRIVVVEQ
jgi:phenylacetate-CoA ligase